MTLSHSLSKAFELNKKDKISIITVAEKQIHETRRNPFSLIGGVVIFSMNKNETLNIPQEIEEQLKKQD